MEGSMMGARNEEQIGVFRQTATICELSYLEKTRAKTRLSQCLRDLAEGPHGL